jgi:hypothetical protein
MNALREKVDAIADQILRLSEQTNQIGGISGLVSDLANQTNMLALNAAVEAVLAGEHGKGLAVVSGEIRKLADQSRKSAEKINALVADIQTAINSTVMVTDEGTKTVEEGVKIAQGNLRCLCRGGRCGEQRGAEQPANFPERQAAGRRHSTGGQRHEQPQHRSPGNSQRHQPD